VASSIDIPLPADAPPTGPAVADPGNSGAPVAPKPADERSRYRQGFQLLRDGQLSAAITALEGYLQDYPQGRYAADARYWIADAHYVEQHFEQALRDFSRLISEHPDSPKVPKALFKIGLVYTELRQPDQARRIYLELRQRYPGSTAARLAGEKLKEF
jgi:tol-pal system protein YbgF